MFQSDLASEYKSPENCLRPVSKKKKTRPEDFFFLSPKQRTAEPLESEGLAVIDWASDFSG
jgi:hypothetical protein